MTKRYLASHLKKQKRRSLSLANVPQQSIHLISQRAFLTLNSDISNMRINTDGKDKKEWELTLFVSLTSHIFDDIKKNDDSQEFFDILEEKIENPNTKILTTVTHNFDYFLHSERLNELKENSVKITPFLMKRDDMGFSKNGTRLLKEEHSDSSIIVEGHYIEKDKKGNFIVVDKLVPLYEYDNKARKAKKILA